MGERQSDRSVRKGEIQGWERAKDKKRFRVGERKIRRETGVVERGRQELERERENKKIKRERQERERDRERKIGRETGVRKR